MLIQRNLTLKTPKRAKPPPPSSSSYSVVAYAPVISISFNGSDPSVCRGLLLGLLQPAGGPLIAAWKILRSMIHLGTGSGYSM